MEKVETQDMASREDTARIEGAKMALEAARNAVSESLWKHEGEDSYSRGLDAGALHQAKACLNAIRALTPEKIVKEME